MIILWAEDWRYKSQKFIDEVISEPEITGLMIEIGKGSERLHRLDSDTYPDSVLNISTDNLSYQTGEYVALTKFLDRPLAQKKIVEWNCKGMLSRYTYLVVSETSIKNLIAMENLIDVSPRFKVCLSYKRGLKFWENQLKICKQMDLDFPKRQTIIQIDLKRDENNFDDLCRFAIDTKKKILLKANEKQNYNYDLFFKALNRQLFNSRITKTIQGSWL